VEEEVLVAAGNFAPVTVELLRPGMRIFFR